jgi:hypothetical protein
MPQLAQRRVEAHGAWIGPRSSTANGGAPGKIATLQGWLGAFVAAGGSPALTAQPATNDNPTANAILGSSRRMLSPRKGNRDTNCVTEFPQLAAVALG